MSIDKHSADGITSFGSYEKFNRVLYGGHSKDDAQNRFFTFAGDTPIFMGASSDYTKDTWCYQAKNGVLMSGLAVTPGHLEGSNDIFSKWFHESCDVKALWHHGYMSYDLSQISSYAPDVRTHIEVYPLFPDDGFLVKYSILPESRMIFCAGFGGITPFGGRYEYHNSIGKEFSAADCGETGVELGTGFAAVSGANDTTMLIGTDFAADFSTDGAAAMEEKFPSQFLKSHSGTGKIVKIVKELKQNQLFTGSILVLRNSTPAKLREYLADADLPAKLRSCIRQKYAGVTFSTPDKLLDSSVPDTIIALDAAFHGKSFYHGAIGYHAPFLGWRGWYAPTLIGWNDRVRSAIFSHFDTITRASGDEKVWWDGGDRPDLDHEGTQYHHLKNSPGHLTALLHRDDIYDMQEVALDMTLHYLEHSGDLETAAAVYDRICELLDWEERILDPDGDGLYQNFLNTWISDGHSYNGAGCAQASSYNYAANLRTAAIGKALGKDTSHLKARAKKIAAAFQNKLWLNDSGVPAESLDTLGNKLIHGVPELSTVYLASECGNTDLIQSFRMLNFVQRNIKTVTTAGRGGKLYFSSNWQPKKYSTCGLFPAENAALAQAFFQNGQPDKAMEIVNGLVDCYALSAYPGSFSHVVGAQGSNDGGDIDFTDVSSCYLRMLIEGMWGVKFMLHSNRMTFAPQLPDSWDHASLTLKDFSATLSREKLVDALTVCTSGNAEKLIRLPMRYAAVDDVFINGESVDFVISSGIKRNFVDVVTGISGVIDLKVNYADIPYPVLEHDDVTVFSGNLSDITVSGGVITGIIDPVSAVESIAVSPERYVVKVTAKSGIFDLLVKVRAAKSEVLLPLTLNVQELPVPKQPETDFSNGESVDLQNFFNASLTEIHAQEFRSPRPAGYSIGMRLNGRYAWEWNHYGHNALHVDDSKLRNCGGRFTTDSGVTFATPVTGSNAVCVSLWDNFPTSADIPLAGCAREAALLICGTTHAMQSYVVNGRISIIYCDGDAEEVELIPPDNFDDFLMPAFHHRGETVYFSDGTHGIVLRIPLDPTRQLEKITVTAVANEVIIDLLGVTLAR